MTTPQSLTTSDFHTALPPQDHEGVQMFDARALHAWLGVGERFTTWIKDRIAQYPFGEAFDFLGVSRKTRGRPRQDYLITLDMAKELAMIERTERGRETRRYFIEMEKAARDMAARTISRKCRNMGLPPFRLAEPLESRAGASAQRQYGRALRLPKWARGYTRPCREEPS